MDRGFIKIWRKIWDNPISQKPNYLVVYVYLLSNANFKDKPAIINNQKIVIERGSFVGSISKIAEQFGLSKSTVHTILKFLTDDRMIKYEPKGTYTLFRLLNYDMYQHNEKLNDTFERGSAQENIINKGLNQGTLEKRNGSSEREPNADRTLNETTKNDKNDKNNTFDLFWEIYDKKINKRKCNVIWNKIIETDKEKILATLPNYLKETPDKKYRKNPETYLENQSWEDEIILSKTKSTLNNQTGNIPLRIMQ